MAISPETATGSWSNCASPTLADASISSVANTAAQSQAARRPANQSAIPPIAQRRPVRSSIPQPMAPAKPEAAIIPAIPAVAPGA